MKPLFFLMTGCLILANSAIFADDAVCPAADEECSECEGPRIVRFRCPPNFENSVIVDPIERDLPVYRPNNHESSFYEMMTR